ncbi:MAG: flagellar basal body P-ring protein FlgI [Phycisphaerales bacterium]|nr:flagellar basal body P-ring protein FlgI [Phycisphaerales bacterium]
MHPLTPDQRCPDSARRIGSIARVARALLPTTMSRLVALLAAIASLCLLPPTSATTVQELTRLKGQGESVLRGLGLVMGLPGTGDSGKELAMARPLAQWLRNNGNETGALKELQGVKNVAVVSVTVVVPAMGALADDTLDVEVVTVNSCKSLKGGRLSLCPLMGPYVGDEHFALAEGPIDVDATTPTVGKVRLGARMVRDIKMPEVKDVFELIIQPHFSGWPSATQIVSTINDQQRANPGDAEPPVAEAVDERTIRVTIPKAERPQRAAFIADIMSTEVNPRLLGLPAMVICNRRSGAIILTADVTVSPVAITHRDLTITTTTPPPTPTPQDPLIDRDKWMSITPRDTSTSQAARLSDLLAAFNRLDIPIDQQMEILQMLSKGGQLQGKLVID